MPTLFDATWATQRPSSTSPWRELDRAAARSWSARSSGEVVGEVVGEADVDGGRRGAREPGAPALRLSRSLPPRDGLPPRRTAGGTGPAPPLRAEGDWRTRLERWAWATVRAMRAPPWATQALVAGPPLAPNSVAWF